MSDKKGRYKTYRQPGNAPAYRAGGPKTSPFPPSGGRTTYGGGPAPHPSRTAPPWVNGYIKHHRPDVRTFGRKVIEQGARKFGPVVARAAGGGFLAPFIFTGGPEAAWDYFFAPAVPETENGVVPYRYPTNGYWEKRYGDFGPYTGHINIADRVTSPNTWHTSLTGQALATTYIGAAPWSAGTWDRYSLWYLRVQAPTRYAHHSSYFRQNNALTPEITSHNWGHLPQPVPFAPPPWVPTDPNYERASPSPKPYEIAPGNRPATTIEEEFENGVPPWRAIEVGFLPGVPPGLDTKTETKTKPPPLPPHRTEPPSARTKEKKVLSTTKKIGIAIAKGLDFTSEMAEIVDAVFRSLPADVQKRWEKGRKKRPFADSAGQYGIDGADWKLQALWHNWHKIDGAQAVRNIAINEAEDKLYGQAFKARNRVLGRGKHRGNVNRFTNPGKSKPPDRIFNPWRKK